MLRGTECGGVNVISYRRSPVGMLSIYITVRNSVQRLGLPFHTDKRRNSLQRLTAPTVPHILSTPSETSCLFIWVILIKYIGSAKRISLSSTPKVTLCHYEQKLKIFSQNSSGISSVTTVLRSQLPLIRFIVVKRMTV